MDPYIARKEELYEEKKKLWFDSKILQKSIVDDKEADRVYYRY